MQDITKRVADMEAELTHLRTRAVNDDKMIALLKRQNEDQSMLIATMSHDHDRAVREMKQERDIAIRKALEVRGILDATASSIIGGLRKMHGDETPPSIPDTPERNPVSITRGLDHENGCDADTVFELMPSRRRSPAVSLP
jgi:hypothetical protein